MWLMMKSQKQVSGLFILPPPYYDEVKGRSSGYSAVLDLYADWLLAMRSLVKWEVIDIHYRIKKYVEAHRKVEDALAPGITESLKNTICTTICKTGNKRQNLMRDAWLTATKHKRSGLPVGLPLNEVEIKSDSLLQQVNVLIDKRN